MGLKRERLLKQMCATKRPAAYCALIHAHDPQVGRRWRRRWLMDFSRRYQARLPCHPHHRLVLRYSLVHFGIVSVPLLTTRRRAHGWNGAEQVKDRERRPTYEDSLTSSSSCKPIPSGRFLGSLSLDSLSFPSVATEYERYACIPLESPDTTMRVG
jgi:hypothetical protein